jgi:hypothetical protein
MEGFIMKKLCSTVLVAMFVLGVFRITAFATNVRGSNVFSGTSTFRSQISVSSTATHGVNGLRVQAQNITNGQRSAVAERSRTTNIPSTEAAL